MEKVSRNNCSRKICFSTNLNCNLDCIYCYEHKEAKDVLDVDYIKNKLADVLSQETEKGTLIKLHGGEPFLAFNKLKALCEYIWEQNFPERFMIHMTTNGTLIHGSVQHWLHKHRDHISLKLSVDGTPAAHNLNRSNSYDKMDIPFFLRTWPDIEAKMTVSPQSLPFLSEGVIHLHELGFKNISVSFAEMAEWNKDKISIYLFNEMEKLSDFYLKHPDLPKCTLYKVSFRYIQYTKTLFSPCTIGSKEAFDFHTGKSYPCHLYFESVCGKNISDNLCKIDLTQQCNRVDKHCEKCAFLNICHTCYVANYISRGSTNKRDMNHCFINQIRFLCCARYLIRYVLNNKQELEPNENDYLLYKDMMAINHISPELSRLEVLLNTKDPIFA